MTKQKHLTKKVQLWLIGSHLRAFQWAEDEQRTLSLNPQFGYCGNSDSPDGATWRTCGQTHITKLHAGLYTCLQTVCLSHWRSMPKWFTRNAFCMLDAHSLSVVADQLVVCSDVIFWCCFLSVVVSSVVPSIAWKTRLRNDLVCMSSGTLNSTYAVTYSFMSLHCFKQTARRLWPHGQHCSKIMKPPHLTTTNSRMFTSSSARLSSH